MGKYSKYSIITDLDGTLLTDGKTISEIDKNSINKFVEGGGQFSIATGRIIDSAMPYINQLPINIPVITYNGGVIYDIIKSKVIWEALMPKEARAYTKEILAGSCKIGAEVLIGRKVYIPQMNYLIKEKMEIEHLSYEKCSIDTIPENWIKVVFTVNEDQYKWLKNFVEAKKYKGVTFMRSFGCYYEMLPYGVSKGNAIKKMQDLKIINDRIVAGVGDYNNDIEMIETADIGVCVANANAEAKAHADIVLTKSNNNGAIAELIDQINY